jgi:hypothetical protein
MNSLTTGRVFSSRMGSRWTGESFQNRVREPCLLLEPWLWVSLGRKECIAKEPQHARRDVIMAPARVSLCRPHVLSRTTLTNAATSGSFEALGPATLSTRMPCSSTNRRSTASASESPIALERWSTGLPCLRATSIVFLEPPVSLSTDSAPLRNIVLQRMPMARKTLILNRRSRR